MFVETVFSFPELFGAPVQKKLKDQAEIVRVISRFCDYQDRCVQEVQNKLIKLGLSMSEIQSIIDQLVEQDLINEARFAKNYARGKFRMKNWGKHRIRTALRSRNIPDPYIQTALSAIETSEYLKVLHDLALKKLEGMRETDNQKRRKKLWDLLTYRGWEKDLIYDKIRELVP